MTTQVSSSEPFRVTFRALNIQNLSRDALLTGLALPEWSKHAGNALVGRDARLPAEIEPETMRNIHMLGSYKCPADP